MSITAVSSAPTASNIAPATPVAPASAAKVGGPVADSPNDGDGDDKPIAPATSPASQSSGAVQDSLSSLKLGG